MKHYRQLSDRFLDSRGLFQRDDGSIRSGSGSFWGRSDSRGVVRDGDGDYRGRISRGGRFNR